MSGEDPPSEQVQAAAAETVIQVTEAITAAEVAKEAKPNDVVVIAVKGIIVLTTGALAGIVGLLAQGRDAPDGLVGLASAGMGALATLLTVRGRRESGG